MRTDEIDALVSACASESKRWGGDPGYLHLAVVLARRWDDEFVEVFGEDGLESVRERLSSKQFLGDEAAIRELLIGNDRAHVLARLAGVIDLSTSVTTSTANADTADGPTTDESASATEELAEGAESESAPQQIHGLATRLDGETITGRDGVLRELTALLMARSVGPIIVAGPAGAGRSSLLAALPTALNQSGVDLVPYLLNPGVSADDLYRLLRQAPEDSLIVIDDLDRRALLRDSPPAVEYLRALRMGTQQTKARIVATVEARNVPRFDAALPGYGHHLALGDLDDEATALERALSEVHSRYPGIEPDEELRAAVGAPPTRTDSYSHPGLAARRLDLSLARAAVAGRSTANVDDLFRDGSVPELSRTARELSAALKARIKGQDNAIEAVTRRITLTRSNLDLRPERPNGVFLFVGPTGVGKTELAREIARLEYGSGDALIRLDMSEYSHSWGVSRLTGPMPGYSGSDTPDEWLTTKVANKPRCVVLLDEIEKAHPVVWNTFLQVFDAGRLTDSLGTTADFRDAVVVMTSNLGARESQSKSVGFGDVTNARRSRALANDALRKALPPELLNRIDEIAQFETLAPEAIAEIARLEVAAAVQMLADRGWSVEVDDAVVDRLATTGYDPAYGARHLQRNIEHHLLAELVTFAERGAPTVHVSIVDGEVTITEN